MLGLGNTVLQSSPSDDSLPILGQAVDGFTFLDDWTTVSSVRVQAECLNSSTFAGLNNITALSTYAKLTGTTFSLKAERWSDTEANGGSVLASGTITVFAHKKTTASLKTDYYVGIDSSDPIGPSALTQNTGSTLIDFTDLNGTDITTTGAALYRITLTVSASGYQDFVAASDFVTLST